MCARVCEVCEGAGASAIGFEVDCVVMLPKAMCAWCVVYACVRVRDVCVRAVRARVCVSVCVVCLTNFTP